MYLGILWYILKVYLIYYVLRKNTNVKKFPSDKINGTKNVPTHHNFTFNVRLLHELKARFVSQKLWDFPFSILFQVYIFIQENAWMS